MIRTTQRVWNTKANSGKKQKEQISVGDLTVRNISVIINALDKTEETLLEK